MKIVEGYMPFKGYKTYYRIVGECEEGKLPLLAVHGGPGTPHDYLESLDALAEKCGRQVIYYDQIGCGKSEGPKEGQQEFYCQELFEEELAELRKYLKLDHCHLLGQSWGGMLIMLYATHHPVGVESMVVASSPASSSMWIKESNRLVSYLPQNMQDAIWRAEETGDYEDPEYIEAYHEYYRRHVCKLDPYPDFVERSFNNIGDSYYVMEGESEFVMKGKLKLYDVTVDLPSVTIPTLVTNGQLDEATPLMAKEIYDLIPGCKWVMFEGGTHLCHVEMADEFNATVEKFLEEHE